jgi:hypothetical protein
MLFLSKILNILLFKLNIPDFVLLKVLAKKTEVN